MKKPIFSVLFTAGLLSLAAQAGHFEVDPSHSNVSFTVRHIVSKVSGDFSDYEGTFMFDEKKPNDASVNFTVKSASIDTKNKKRDDHLKSPDFFNIEKFPTITFKSTKVNKTAGKNKFKVMGDMTMLGVTKPTTWDVEFLGKAGDPWGNMRAGFTASTKINRKDFGMNWNKTLDKGGIMLGEDVTLNLNVEAIEKKMGSKDAPEDKKVEAAKKEEKKEEEKK